MIFQLQFRVPNDMLAQIKKGLSGRLHLHFGGVDWEIAQQKDDRGYTLVFVAYYNGSKWAKIEALRKRLEKANIPALQRFVKDQK